MTQLIAQYRTREAIVSIIKSDGGFRVQMDRLTVRGGSEHRAYPIEELDSAVVRAQTIVSKISGYSIEEKCAFGNNRTKHLCFLKSYMIIYNNFPNILIDLVF